MASSWVDVANAALTKCGAATIVSLTDATREAQVINLRLYPCRDIVLRMHPWKDAMQRVILSPLTTIAPAFGYMYYFQIPADCLRIMDIDSGNDYRLEGDKIATDDGTVNLLYIQRIDDPTTMDSMLSDLIASYLAKDIIYTLTQDGTMTKVLKDDFELLLRLAKNVDSKSNNRRRIEMGWLTDIRLGGSSTGYAPAGYPLAPGAP